MPTATTSLYDAYAEVIDRAIAAVHDRTFFAHYPEPPSGKIYGETANDEGMAAFERQLGQPFALKQSGSAQCVSDETSPYTREKLGISYPVEADPEAYIRKAQAAAPAWRAASVQTRAGILMASLDKLRDRFFEMAYATMHTTGQAFVMSFQASGPHANDRALEAIALGVHELSRFPAEPVTWVKPMGKFDITLEKRFHAVPKGIGLCIGVSTFPVWNTVPGLYADLITGNPAIVKPHPLSIYPIALVVQALQEVLAEQGFDPHTVQLAADQVSAPITSALAEHPAIKLIDFTGGNAYGDYVEGLKGKTTFTEKAGVNSVIIDSLADPKRALGNLAFSVSMYTGQMCTAPQNIFIPRSGVPTADGHLSYAEVVAAFTGAIQGLLTNPKAGPGVLGAVQSEATYDRAAAAKNLGVKVLLDDLGVENPDFPKARMATPIVLEVPADRADLYSREMFGPVVMIIPTDDTAHSLRLAQQLAGEQGAIGCTAYSTDPAVQAQIELAMAEVFTPVSFNFTGFFWPNQNAGFSDFHVTGGNRAGNASLTDPSFLRQRFVLVGSRTQVG